MNNFEEICEKVLSVINKFPKSWKQIPYITLKDWHKCYMDIFIKKYGINGNKTKYTESDVIRRIRLIEFFDSFCKLHNTSKSGKNENDIIDSEFYRMVIGKKYNHKWNYRSVLISFYHHT